MCPAVALLVFCGLGVEAARADAIALGESYMLTEHWGGQWQDVEKSPLTGDDDELCWAAAASNILTWGGWTDFEPFNGSPDEVFDYYVEHWSNSGSMMKAAWQWWLNGVNPYQGLSGWAQVTETGGRFYPDKPFDASYASNAFAEMAMQTVHAFLTQGFGVALAIYRPKPTGGLYGHAISVWGINFDVSEGASYLGLWVTDSDDDKALTDPADRLRYYEVSFSELDQTWRLRDYFSSDQWYIGSVQAFKAVPEPTAASLMAAGSLIVLRRRRKAS